MVYYCQLCGSAKWEIVSPIVFKRWNQALVNLQGGARYTGKRFILNEDTDEVELIGSFSKNDLTVVAKIRTIIPTTEPFAIEPEQVILEDFKGKKEVHFKGGYKATMKAA